MDVIWYLIRITVSGAIDILMLIMLVQAIMSWFSPMPESKIGIFVYNVTEFFVAPVRALLSRFSFVRSCPIDISFSVTYLILLIFSFLI